VDGQFHIMDGDGPDIWLLSSEHRCLGAARMVVGQRIVDHPGIAPGGRIRAAAPA
jgi:hypothetical protein